MIKTFLHIALIGMLTLSAKISIAQNHHKNTYKIALVLPFKSVGVHNNVGEAMLDYYQGFVMGAKQLENEGFKSEISVFDSDKDSLALENLINNGTLDNSNLIVGPVYSEKLKLVEQYCTSKNITLVSPLKYYKPLNPGNGIINFFLPDSLRMIATFEKAIKIYPKHRFYVIYEASNSSKKDAFRIKNKAVALGFNNIKLITVTNGKISSPINRNDSIIIFNTIEKTTVKPILEKLILKKGKSWIIAHHNWHSDFKSIINIDEPNIIYPEVTVSSPGDTSSVDFQRQYYKNYYSDPSKYSLIGYDQATFIGYGLMAFGDSFVHSTSNMDYRGFINHIHLKIHENEVLNFGLHFIRILEGTREEIEP
jgi:hypothetical protein